MLTETATDDVAAAAGTMWRRQIQSLFEQLPETSATRNAAVAELYREFRVSLAQELSLRIATTFAGKFDENGRPVETLAEMQTRSAEVRGWLNEFGFALVNQKNGKACQDTMDCF